MLSRFVNVNGFLLCMILNYYSIDFVISFGSGMSIVTIYAIVILVTLQF